MAKFKSKGLRYAFRDGFVSLKRHPLILLASITTMTLMLFLLAVFMAFAMNVTNLIKIAGQQPPIEIQFKQDAADGEITVILESLYQDDRVVENILISPEENFERFKEQLGKDELFSDFDYLQYIPYTITVRLSDPALGEQFYEDYANLPGVREVQMEAQVMSFLQQAIRSVSIASLLIFIALGVISSFIISNMVRVAALSRSVEISIMKYMGATNRYIRIPFIVEGVVVGLVSALLATLLAVFAYEGILLRWDPDLATSSFRLMYMGEILPSILLVTFAVGIILGGVSSGLSVKKYVQV